MPLAYGDLSEFIEVCYDVDNRVISASSTRCFMGYCFVLSVLFLVLSAALLVLGFKKGRQSRAGRLNLNLLGATISASGLQAACIGGAVIFSLMAFLTFANCGPENASLAHSSLASATASLVDAESREAHKFATGELATAQRSFETAEAELRKQESKLPPFRDFSEAIQLLGAAKRNADMAKEVAVAGKLTARTTASAELVVAEGNVEAVNLMLRELGSCKRKPKGFDADLEALGSRNDGLRAELSGCHQSIGAEDFLGATKRARLVKDQADILLADLHAAMAKIKCVD